MSGYTKKQCCCCRSLKWKKNRDHNRQKSQKNDVGEEWLRGIQMSENNGGEKKKRIDKNKKFWSKS